MWVCLGYGKYQRVRSGHQHLHGIDYRGDLHRHRDRSQWGNTGLGRNYANVSGLRKP